MSLPTTADNTGGAGGSPAVIARGGSSVGDGVMQMLHIHDLNKNIANNRLAFFGCLIFFYVCLSVAFYSGFEEMSVLDAVYYAIITMSTVGYGDKKPETLEGRLFAIFFVLLGFSVLAYGFSLAASFALHKAETMKAKHETRVNTLMNKVADIRMPSFASIKGRLSISGGRSRNNTNKPSVEEEGDDDDIDTAGIQLHENSTDSSDLAEDIAMLRDVEAGAASSFGSVSQLSEAYRNSFRWETYKMRRRCIRNLLLISTFMVVASLAMMAQEGWTFSDSVYWAVVTITTVGYGDYTPTTHGGKVITLVYVLLGCVSMASIWSELIKYPLMLKFKENELAIISQFDENVSAESLKSIGQSRLFASIPNMKTSSVDEMSKIEFVLGMLELMGKVQRSDAALAASMFDRLDSNDDGLINCEEMAQAMQQLSQPSSPQQRDSQSSSKDDTPY
mmetsp:Transcript_17195/g.28772  ORF Transcript_17195/g.28772 Transcript_17195/m.28772 type:complete len:448 (-) Transcript_17195:39-1382(-)